MTESSISAKISGQPPERRGVSQAELKEARKALGVKTFHQFDEDGDTQNWFWYLEV